MSKILIDATSLIRKATGIEYYTLQLIKNLLTYDNENKYIILFRNSIHKELLAFKDKAKFIVFKNKSQIFCEQFWIPQVIFKEKPDLVHFPAFPPGLLVFHKNIVFTLHDATMWKHKRTTSWKNKLYMKPLSELAIKKSKKIFTVSEDSKKNIVDIFLKSRDKIVVTSESISEKYTKIRDIQAVEQVKKRFYTGDIYLLSVCSLEPRKNIPKLLEAFHGLIKKRKEYDLKLVLVGRKAWGNNIINNKIEELNLKERIVITDYVSDEDLLCLYNGAYCFIYPSLYEGFGLPILEAMACGIPVITSNNSSIPEVAGDAAILINSSSKNEIEAAISKVLHDIDLREKMIKKGYARVRNFSWEKIIKNVVNQYKGII
ncbi:MAG: glycosyltransferase family 4 protein [Clostridiaceae bacterium]